MYGTSSCAVCVQIDPEQVVLAETPAKICKHLHNKHCYAVGQDNYLEIAKEYAFPLLSFHFVAFAPVWCYRTQLLIPID